MNIDGVEVLKTRQMDNALPVQKNSISDREKIAARKTSREFESLFVGMVLKSMRETVGKDILAGKGQSEEIYRSMLDQEYARAITEQGGVGLASTIEKQLLDQVKFKKSETGKAGGTDVIKPQ